MGANPTIAAARLRGPINVAGLAWRASVSTRKHRVEFEKETPKEAYGLAVPLELGGNGQAHRRREGDGPRRRSGAGRDRSRRCATTSAAPTSVGSSPSSWRRFCASSATSRCGCATRRRHASTPARAAARGDAGAARARRRRKRSHRRRSDGVAAHARSTRCSRSRSTLRRRCRRRSRGTPRVAPAPSDARADGEHRAHRRSTADRSAARQLALADRRCACPTLRRASR